MKKLISLLVAGGLLLPSFLFAQDDLSERLKGYILLQVEQHGEAWYVHPDSGERFYMPDGDSAYALMRYVSLGIKNDDLSVIPDGTTVNALRELGSVCESNEMAERLRGRILLQVEDHGEAWYVSPYNCYRVYMPDGEAAYEMMRELSLGIADSDLDVIPSIELEVEIVEEVVVEKPIIEEEEPVVEEEPEEEIVEHPDRVIEEEDEEPEARSIPVPVVVTISSSNSRSILYRDQSEYGYSAISNRNGAGLETDYLDSQTTDHVLALEPIWKPHSNIEMLVAEGRTDEIEDATVTVTLGVENPGAIGEIDEEPGFTCERSGSDFWQGTIYPWDHSVQISIRDELIDFWLTVSDADEDGNLRYDEEYTKEYQVKVTCTNEAGVEYRDYVKIKLTTNFYLY